ncbi:P33 [Urbanus proteus nucleopolyhedrovirus]|uniref:P33 n=1 Tax=Urbanus proteus nucleopolyhedrovirus TaxID=1675866 RepID=A0A162GUW0_9ABAC|nr:P33 [Urbanus proteus nucleopolyhedrovirus]AKR17373.1 P33 [Urbanus proteus nucleopolyhedrovirus]
MLPYSPLFARYKNSFLLCIFRYFERIRSINNKYEQFAKTLATELAYLYDIACFVTYKSVLRQEREQIIDWMLSLSHDEIDIEALKSMYEQKLQELNLRALIPNNYTYTYTTIWDFIHFLSILIDDLVEQHNTLDYAIIVNHLLQIKIIFFNLFLKLDCSMCREHYMKTKGYLICAIEHIELCLHRNKYDNKLILTNDLVLHTHTENDNNLLMKHYMLYMSMNFHNHVNSYRWIQRDIKPPADYKIMKWNEYKNSLGFK